MPTDSDYRRVMECQEPRCHRGQGGTLVPVKTEDHESAGDTFVISLALA
jgi:hypothetical protein